MDTDTDNDSTPSPKATAAAMIIAGVLTAGVSLAVLYALAGSAGLVFALLLALGVLLTAIGTRSWPGSAV